MSGLTDFLTVVLGSLNDSGHAYLITGSFASTVYSEPRTTMDIDIVVHASLDGLEEFRDVMIRLGLYVPSIGPDTDMFNIIDTESGWKADIIRWQDEAFERSRFSRRVRIELLPGLEAYVPTVEDVILAKLRWIIGRDSPLQLRDVESMVEMNRGVLDLEYLRDWSVELGVAERLEAVLAAG